MRRVLTAAAVAALLVAAVPAAVFAVVQPNPLFSEGAVLQRDIELPVWGDARSGEKVTVSIAGRTASTTAGANGSWMVRLDPIPAGGPYTLTISGDNRLEIPNVLVGEVWVCSGQSNMVWRLKDSTGAEEHIAASADDGLRLLAVPQVPQTRPIDSTPVSWAAASPETTPQFSAVAYFFGRDLRKALGVPVGLINTSWGGTIVQAWTPSRYVTNASQMRWAARQKEGWQNNPNRPGVLYNGMIAPLVPYAIRGAIWYQGESNAGDAYGYRTHFPTMIRSWREAWDQGDFTFLFVQLAPFMAISTEPQDSAWAELREAQLLTTQTVPATGMAVITDCGDPADVHPKLKEPVGARLALAARAIAYGERIVYSGPTYRSVRFKGNRAIVSFDAVGGGLTAKDGPLTGFTIAGADRKFYNAAAELAGNTVVVSSPQVPKPAAVRYGWAHCPVVNLFNAEGLPASPFRTDDWPGITQPKGN